MNYMGQASPEWHNKLKELYGFIQKALCENKTSPPFRGPDKYQEESFLYKSSYKGNFELFQGKEEVNYDSMNIYQGFFHGGFINKL